MRSVSKTADSIRRFRAIAESVTGLRYAAKAALANPSRERMMDDPGAFLVYLAVSDEKEEQLMTTYIIHDYEEDDFGIEDESGDEIIGGDAEDVLDFIEEHDDDDRYVFEEGASLEPVDAKDHMREQYGVFR